METMYHVHFIWQRRTELRGGDVLLFQLVSGSLKQQTWLFTCSEQGSCKHTGQTWQKYWWTMYWVGLRSVKGQVLQKWRLSHFQTAADSSLRLLWRSSVDGYGWTKKMSCYSQDVGDHADGPAVHRFAVGLLGENLWSWERRKDIWLERKLANVVPRFCSSQAVNLTALKPGRASFLLPLLSLKPSKNCCVIFTWKCSCLMSQNSEKMCRLATSIQIKLTREFG